MKEYLLALVGASLALGLISILTPQGSSGHIKLLSSLMLILLLISPVKGVLDTVMEWSHGDLTLPGLEEDGGGDPSENLTATVTEASKDYFVRLLTERLQAAFDMKSGTVRCTVTWETVGEEIRPKLVTVILSGASIWRDPHEIVDYVTELLHCECATAIE